LHDLTELNEIVASAKEWFPTQRQPRQHATDTPQIDSTVIVFPSHEQFRSLVVTTRDAHIVRTARVIEIGDIDIEFTDGEEDDDIEEDDDEEEEEMSAKQTNSVTKPLASGPGSSMPNPKTSRDDDVELLAAHPPDEA
jgi:hypothetical protein